MAIGFNLPYINLRGHNFPKPIVFALTKFEKADFSNTKFKEVIFSGTKFELVDFKLAEFEKANFSKAKFVYADFSYAKFEKAYFRLAEFKIVDFLSAKINKADFSKAEFKEAKFLDAEFREVDFSETKFEKAYFEGTVFWERAVFDGAFVADLLLFKEIHPCSMFNACRASSYISLRNVRFGENAKIVIDGCFIDRFSFINTDLSPKRLVIKNPKYSLKGNEIVLVDRLLFSAKNKLKKYSDLLYKYEKYYKEYCRRRESGTEFKTIDRLLLELKLKWTRLQMKVHKVDKALINKLAYAKNFTDECKEELEYRKVLEEFPENNERKNGLFRRSINDIIDLFKLEPSELRMILEDARKIITDGELTLDNVLSVYRGLRDNFDYMLRYEASGKLFVGEMRLRKETADLKDKILFMIYDGLAVYGESVWRPIIWSIFIILVFSIVLNWDYADSATINLKLRESILTFFQMRSIENCGWASLIERLIAIPIFGSFIIALRRKLERRIRH